MLSVNKETSVQKVFDLLSVFQADAYAATQCLERLSTLGASADAEAFINSAGLLVEVVAQHESEPLLLQDVSIIVSSGCDLDEETCGRWKRALAAAGMAGRVVAGILEPAARNFEGVPRNGCCAIEFMMLPVGTRTALKAREKMRGEAIGAGLFEAVVHTLTVASQPMPKRGRTASGLPAAGSCAETFAVASRALEHTLRIACNKYDCNVETQSELQAKAMAAGALPALTRGMRYHESNAEAQSGALDAIAVLTMKNDEAVSIALAEGAKDLIAAAADCHGADEPVKNALSAGATKSPDLFPPVILPSVQQGAAMRGELQMMATMMSAMAGPAEETSAPPGFVRSALERNGLSETLPDALTAMAVIGDVEALKEYVSSGGAVDARSIDGKSFLHYACSEETALVAPQAAQRRELFVAELLAQGASASLRDKDGWTPLQLAANTGSTGLARLLLKAGADPSAADPRGYTPLHQAVWKQCEEVIDMLISARASLDMQQRTGLTPLAVAVGNGMHGVAEKLLRAGARKDLADNEGTVVLQIAQLRCDVQMTTLLQSARCSHCGVIAERAQLKQCARCKSQSYCGATCQKAAWKAGHKLTCSPLQETADNATTKQSKSKKGK